MGMFEMTDDQAAEWGQKFRDLVAPHVNGEEVVSAAAFRRGGATASMVASKAQLGGAGYDTAFAWDAVTALTVARSSSCGGATGSCAEGHAPSNARSA